jgi:hypothetical protein
MNDLELKKKVNSAMYTLIKKNGIASPIEVLTEIGVLSKEDCERWRLGKVDYLERVCKINLSKLSTINHEIRVFAEKNNLPPSWTYYKRRGVKGKNIKLRFSKSGGEEIERLYATHYVSQRKTQEAREHKNFQKRKNELAQTIAPCGLICGLCSESADCSGCRDGCCKRAEVCYQRKCCEEKQIRGCWKCADFSCGRDMFSPERGFRIKAFVRCAKEDGIKGFAGHLLRNQENGILYHRDTGNHLGDYDGLESEEAVLKLLRNGKSEMPE